MGIIVAKFGGTSNATGACVKASLATFLADPDRRYILASAPGVSGGLPKVTDDLLALRTASAARKSEIITRITARFASISHTLDISYDIESKRHELHVLAAASPDVSPARLASWGERVMGGIIAAALDLPFVEDLVRFDAEGRFDMDASRACVQRLPSRAVIASFYGYAPDGTTHTFERGGGDTSGAIVAALVGAELYENRTDRAGVYAIHPDLCAEARIVPELTYEQMGELSERGAPVLHHHAVYPVRQAHIPIRICRYDSPRDAGTLIVPRTESPPGFVAIAGKSGYTMLRFKRPLMGSERGYLSRLTAALFACGIGVELVADGEDGVGIAVDDREYGPNRDAALRGIAALGAELQVVPDVGIVCLVGNDLGSPQSRLARVFETLERERIPVHSVTLGVQTSVRLAIPADQLGVAQTALYEACIA